MQGFFFTNLALLLKTSLLDDCYVKKVKRTCVLNQLLFFLLTDVDECKNADVCEDNAQCTNTEGSYNCSCKDGYRGNGVNCSGKGGIGTLGRKWVDGNETNKRNCNFSLLRDYHRCDCYIIIIIFCLLYPSSFVLFCSLPFSSAMLNPCGAFTVDRSSLKQIIFHSIFFV